MRAGQERQPQTEVVVQLVLLGQREAFVERFQLRHVVRCQVAVLEHRPLAFLARLLQRPARLRRLPLT